ncbi:MAG: hypothetical protein Q9226_004997 [Calogaya cf. arnoldii]
MTTFQSVNVGLGPHEHQYGVTTPTTPRAPTQLQSQAQSAPITEELSTTTPTRLNFGGVSGQRPLPTSPFPSSFPIQQPSTNLSNPRHLSREHSHRSTHSAGSHDIDMDMSDEGEGASDDESIDAETGRPSKKKKGQKFYCTDFPPCNLSFTRSEHLARHIRIPPSTSPQPDFSKESSEGLSTPTSTTFSNGASSPGYRSTYGSPVSTVSRNGGYWGGNSYHGRRLSVPSGPNPFQSPQSQSYPTPYLSPLAPSNTSLASSNSSMYGSPTNSSYSFSRRETPAEAEWRRRTWHPTTYNSYPRPATSGLSYYRTPDDAPQPAFAPQAAATPASSFGQRLPGIETFDQIPNRNTSPVRRGGSPMQVDSPNRPPIYPGPSATSGPNDRRGHQSWDLSLHQNLTKLDIANSAPINEANGWTQQLIPEVRSDPPYKDSQPRPTNFSPQPAPVMVHHEAPNAPDQATSPTGGTSYRSKRQGWYNGPLNVPPTAVRRKSPEGSSSSESVPTPSFSTAEYHPSIVGSDGYIEGHNIGHPNILNGSTQPPAYQYPADSHTATSQQQHVSQDNKMSNLEVLVAVATNENSARSTNA